MMKKIFAILLALTLAFSVCGMLFSCGEEEAPPADNGGNNTEPPKHTHAFTLENNIETYRKSAATHESAAVYYKSCTCGEPGTETFTFGDPVPHTFDQKIAVEKYLKSEATAETGAIYYMSCICGVASTEDTFVYGDPTHSCVYDQQVTTETYLATPADHKNAAVYYWSCECGFAGEETFTYGDPIPHTFDQRVVNEKYLASEATTTAPAYYYLSCICLEHGEETFSHGDRLKTIHEQMKEAVDATAPTSVTAVIKTSSTAHNLTVTSTATLNATTNTVEVQVMNKLDMDADTVPGEMITTETRAAINGENTVLLGKLTFSEEYLSDIAVSNGVYSATISNTAAFFGGETSFASADFVMTTVDGVVTQIVITYTTANNNAVEMTVTFA